MIIEVLNNPSPKDYQNLTEIYSEVHWIIDPENTQRRVENVLANPTSDLLIVRDDNQIVSALVVNILYRPGKTKAEIEDVATKVTHQRRGYMGKLIDFAIKYLNDKDVTYIFLCSSEKSKVAHPLYKSRDFVIEETNYFSLGEDR